jgi:predicted metal-dependent hydrolase
VTSAEGFVEAYERGLRLLARGEHFAAHEALEEAWRAASPQEREFFQGLVHVAVAWYQAGRGNAVGCERQLEKAARRLAPFTPAYRDLDVASLLQQVEAARGRFPALAPVVLTRGRGSPAPC